MPPRKILYFNTDDGRNVTGNDFEKYMNDLAVIQAPEFLNRNDSKTSEGKDGESRKSKKIKNNFFNFFQLYSIFLLIS